MLLNTHNKAEKYIKNNTLNLNNYLKKNASPHTMKRAMKTSLWQDNWQQQKAKTTVESPKDAQKSKSNGVKNNKKDAPERPHNRDDKSPKEKTKKESKKDSGETDSKNTKSDSTKKQNKKQDGDTATEPKNAMISKQSLDANDLIAKVQNMDETEREPTESSVLIINPENQQQDSDDNDNTDEPAWEFFQKQADQDTPTETDKSTDKDTIKITDKDTIKIAETANPAVSKNRVVITPEMQKTTEGETTELTDKKATFTVQQTATTPVDDKQKKTLDTTVKTSDTSQQGDGVDNDAVKIDKDVMKSTKMEKSMDTNKGGEKLTPEQSKDPLDVTKVRDTIKTAQNVQQKVNHNPESVDMSDLDKLVSELRKIEDKAGAEKRLEKATLEAAGIRRNLENKMLEKQAVQNMMMERGVMENNQRMRQLTTPATATQTDTQTQAPTTPVNPMMAPAPAPTTRATTTLGGGLESSNLASNGGTGGDSGGNNGGGQNKGEQQQGSYTAPKSEGRIMLDLTQQRNWQKTLAVRALQIAQGKGEARMQLHPAEMGALIVRVQVRDGVTRINMVAEKEEAAKLLNENRHILEQSFKEQGMDFQEFDLSQGNASDFNEQNGDNDKDDKPSFAQNLQEQTAENEDTDDENTVIKTNRLVDTMV